MSTTKLMRSTGRPMMKVSPSATTRGPARRTEPSGGTEGSRNAE